MAAFADEAYKSAVGKAPTGALGPNEWGIPALVKAGDVEAVKEAILAASSVRSAGPDDATAKDISTAAKQASLPG